MGSSLFTLVRKSLGALLDVFMAWSHKEGPHPFLAHNGNNLFSTFIIVVYGASFMSYIMFYSRLAMAVDHTYRL